MRIRLSVSLCMWAYMYTVVGSSKWTGRRASWPNAFPVADNSSIAASTDEYLDIDSTPRRRSLNYETYQKTLPSDDEQTTPKTTPTSYATIVKARTSTDRQPLPSPPHTLRSGMVTVASFISTLSAGETSMNRIVAVIML